MEVKVYELVAGIFAYKPQAPPYAFSEDRLRERILAHFEEFPILSEVGIKLNGTRDSHVLAAGFTKLVDVGILQKWGRSMVRGNNRLVYPTPRQYFDDVSKSWTPEQIEQLAELSRRVWSSNGIVSI